jgi:hypothetical protein
MNKDLQHENGHVAWTRTSSMDMDMDMQPEHGHGNAECIWKWTCKMVAVGTANR